MLATDVPLETFWAKLCGKQARSVKEATLRKMSLSDLVEMLGDGKCAYTGKEFETLQDITFERVNPKVGYVPGNVLLVNYKGNIHKAKLDAFMHECTIPDAMKIKLLRKALYQLEKANGKNIKTS